MRTCTNVRTEVYAPDRLACILGGISVVQLIAVEIYMTCMTVL